MDRRDGRELDLVHDAGHTKRRRERGCKHRAKFGAERAGTIVVGDQRFSVTQEPGAPAQGACI